MNHLNYRDKSALGEQIRGCFSPSSLQGSASLQPLSAPWSVKAEGTKLSFVGLGGIRKKLPWALSEITRGRQSLQYRHWLCHQVFPSSSGTSLRTPASLLFLFILSFFFFFLYTHASREKFLLFRSSQRLLHHFIAELWITCYLSDTVRCDWGMWWSCHLGSSVPH